MAGKGLGRARGRRQFFDALSAALLRFAEQQFDRSAAAADGNAKGAHLDAAKRHPLYRAAAADAAPSLPVELAHVWEYFVQLSRKRQCGMAVNPLGSAEILAWQARHRVFLTPFEEGLIDQLDALYLSHQNKAP